ncbi:MAG: DinB family protein [Thermomicrobiales bacterium]|nr:DinB family protein [Thermomicrobiales bacterium]
MDATSVVLQQLNQARNVMNFATAELSTDEWHHRIDGATIQSIASIYAHSSMMQDVLINQRVRDQEPIYDRDNWAEKTGITRDGTLGIGDDLSEALKQADMSAFRDYHAAVAAEVDEYIGSLSAEDLDRTITFGSFGDMPLGVFIGNVIGWHLCHHSGEVAALSGALGHKGSPI